MKLSGANIASCLADIYKMYGVKNKDLTPSSPIFSCKTYLACALAQKACRDGYSALYLRLPRQSAREMVTGECHYVFGKWYRLEVIERWGKHEVIVKNNTTLLLHVRPGTTTANRLLVLNDWYRVQLKKRMPSLLDKWQSKIGVEASSLGVKRMRTRWGSCNIQRKRIWLNLELAKKPPECLEYALVHSTFT